MAAKPSLLRSIVYSFEVFERVLARGGTLTLVVALLALTWANSPWAAAYTYTTHTPLSFAFGNLMLAQPLGFWVSHVLMAVFYLVMGMELKRLLKVGELSTWRDAAIPVAAALGGILVPAAVYLYLNPDAAQAGWSIAAVTDVATVLALLALAGSHLPQALRVFVSSVAILQSLAVLVLTAVLYTTIDNLLALSVGTGVFGMLVVLRALRNRTMWLYLLLGLVILGAFLLAGVSGALAGVLLALVIPVHSRVPEQEFISTADTVMGQLHALHMMKRPEPGEEMEEDYQAAVHTLQANCRKALSPLRQLQSRLLPLAAYIVLPLFALISIPFAYNSFEWQQLLGPVPMGIFLALVLGKPVGILIFALLARLLLAGSQTNPLRWSHLAGAALLSGTGFLLSVFTAVETIQDPDLLILVKISVYAASALAALLGTVVLAFAGNKAG